MSIGQELQLVSRVDQESVSLVWVDLDVDVVCWGQLGVQSWSIVKHGSDVDMSIFLSNLEGTDTGKHHLIVVIDLRVFIL